MDFGYNAAKTAFEIALRPLTTVFPYSFARFLRILPSLFIFYHTYDSLQDQIGAFRDVENKFDFIIVGAGSAGSVVANRLSENHTVLLLEAGGEPNPLHRIPLMTLLLLQLPFADWGYYTTPQKNACLAMNSQQCSWPRGRALGGSSNLNFMLYIRGHKYDYDSWANITGDPRWRWENVLEYFKKSEDYHGEWDDERYHSHGGYLSVMKPAHTGMADILCKAAAESGIPRVDVNADFTEGCSPLHYTQQNGRRMDTYHAFLEPIRERSNLRIRKFSHGSRVIFEGSENRAVGVEYIRHGQRHIAYASKEVILSAGALNSPQILMLSGIGPKEHLESHQIPVLLDLPVGKNLQDHVSTLVGPFIVDEPITSRFENLNVQALDTFTKTGAGPLSSTSIQGTLFFVSEFAKKRGRGDWPDIQHMLLGTSVYDFMDSHFAQGFNVRQDVLTKYYEGVNGKESFQIMNALLHPLSKGQVLLRSKDPLSIPLVDANYFEHIEDIEVIVEGARRAVDIVENSPTFKAMNGRLHNVSFPGCEHVQFRSDEYWECYHRQFSLTVYHQCGTCAMGKADSPNAVVDSELRVIGTKHLRVIDASIMPNVISGNTNAPSIMIGEMGADMVKAAWGY